MMATTSHLGVIWIPVDGAWDIEDLRAPAESLSETYGLFYPLVAQDDDIRKQLQDLVRKQFWSGDIETRHFGQWLYRATRCGALREGLPAPASYVELASCGLTAAITNCHRLGD
jgi:hypothetical protein